MPEQPPISVSVHQSNGKLPASSTLVHGHSGYQIAVIIVIASNNQLPATNKQPNHYQAWVHQQEGKPILAQFMCHDSSMLTLCLLFYAFNLWVYCRPSFLPVEKRIVKFTVIHRNVNTILQYSPSTTSLYHVLDVWLHRRSCHVPWCGSVCLTAMSKKRFTSVHMWKLIVQGCNSCSICCLWSLVLLDTWSGAGAFTSWNKLSSCKLKPFNL